MLTFSVVGSTPAQGQQRKQSPTGPLSAIIWEPKPSVVGPIPAQSSYSVTGIPPSEPLFDVSRLGFPQLETQTLAYGLPHLNLRADEP